MAIPGCCDPPGAAFVRQCARLDVRFVSHVDVKECAASETPPIDMYDAQVHGDSGHLPKRSHANAPPDAAG
jgi:hypothetical protein